MAVRELHAVTGAFSYTGKYIAQRLSEWAERHADTLGQKYARSALRRTDEHSD